MEVDPQDWSQVVRHRRTPPGRVAWRRFALVLTPAVLAVTGITVGALTGLVPVALALEGQQSLKISAQRISAEAFGTFPSFVQAQDGTRRPVVVLDLRRVRASGLCLSTSVPTPMGTYVLRATTPPDRDVTAGDVQFAIQDVDGLDAFGNQIGLNRDRTASDGTPIDTSTGGLPLTVGGLALDLTATARWATVNQIQLGGAAVHVGQDQRPCS